MSNRLQVSLLPNWGDYSHTNPKGPSTYYRKGSERANALQISWAWYKGGKEPRPDDRNLLELACRVFAKTEGYQVPTTNTGECAVGRFGTAISRSTAYPRLQAWILSNGLDFVFVTHICAVDPSAAEIAEADQIVKALTIDKA